MAERVPRASEALQRLQQQVTCQACQNRYTQPRTLSCLHSFCHDCIASFPATVQEEGTRLIACPVCCQEVIVQQDIAAEFPVSFLIEYFLEIHDLLQKMVGLRVICDNCHNEQANGYCKQCAKLLCQACLDMHNQWGEFINHQILSLTDVVDIASSLVPLKEHPTKRCSRHDKPLNVYCDTCSKLICQLCIRHHNGHYSQQLTEALPTHRQQIENKLQQVNEVLATITTATQTMESHEEEFLEHIQEVKKEIENTVQQQIEKLKESERNLMIELEQVINEYSEKVSACKDKAKISISRLNSCKDFAEEELRIGNHQEILQSRKHLMKRMKAVCSQVQDNEFLQPPEESRVIFKRNIDLCSNLGSLVNCRQPAECDDDSIFDPADGLFPCQHSPVPAISNPNVLLRKPKLAFKYLYDPCGIVCTEGHLIVVEEGRHCITVINIADKTVIRKIGKQGRGENQFSSPEGVSLTQEGRIIVADSANHRLQLFTMEGTFVSSVGSKGTRPLQFKQPWAIAIHPQTGKLFVTERESNRVQVLNSDLSYSHRFGKRGVQPGNFKQPYGIAIDSDGMVYVADHGNNRVQKFTPDGNIIVVIDSKNEDMLSSPYGVHIDRRDILYVTELRSNTVCVFDSSGQFQGYVGDSDGSSFRYPRHITSDNHGTLYISDDCGVTPY